MAKWRALILGALESEENRIMEIGAARQVIKKI